MDLFAIDYAAIPPEVNSIRMYSGPGSAPLRTAAGAWGGLAVELHATANAYQSVITELTSWSWLGPASQALAAATVPYVAWLATTAAHADGTAAQANAAAAAYETAFAMTVPPSVVAANRAKFMVLIATNVFGQNTAAIAATDALYAEMWAQDAVAMHGYAASAFAAAVLPSFTPPPNVANPAGQATQAAATSGNVVGSGVQSVLSQLAGQAAAVAAPAQGIEDLFTLPSLSDLAGVNALSALSVALSAGAWMAADESTRQILNEQDQVREIEYDILNAIDLFSPLTPSRPIGAVGWSGGLSAGLGDAVTVGRLSVPISWAAAAPEIRSLSYTTPLAGPGLGAGAVPPTSLSAMGSAFSQMGLAGMGGSALAGSVSRGRREAAGPDAAGPKTRGPNTAAPGRSPQTPVVAPLPATAAAGESEGVPLTGIAAEIREFAELRDRGLITNDEYHEQKMRLLGR